MSDNRKNLQEETAYLEKTVTLIESQLASEAEDLAQRKRKLIASRKDMWENTVHFSTDFARLTEANQYLSEVNLQAAVYTNTLKAVEKYKRMIGNPYFGRFDFVEDSSNLDFAEDEFSREEHHGSAEKIYIGLGNVVNQKTQEVYVYDWRAPISSIFYRYEPGKAAFEAPVGMITGEVLLKRQYKIRDSQLKYFFDCSVTINDEILQQILSHNSSPKMRNIVETIQKEQDIIIRDTESDLLIVQGVAGSGKTSIALHRVAYLLYDGLNAHLGSGNVLILSPNAVFSTYISSVLPELGEENVEQATFDDIANRFIAGRFTAETREMQLESLIQSRENGEGGIRRKSIVFKGSRTFAEILDRLLWHFEHHMLSFEDVYFNGNMLFSRQELKNRFLNDKTGLPMAKRLKRLENIILDKVQPLRKIRLKKIEPVVAASEGHELEIKPFSRLLSMKEARAFLQRLQRFTKVDYYNLYQTLFSKPGLLFKLSGGLELPENMDQIIAKTKGNLEKGQVYCEDSPPLLYLKLRMEGSDLFPDIKQVVIDEAQDYSPLQYNAFKLLFKDAKYTVLGDINQTIEKDACPSLYDDIAAILDKQKAVKLFLNKGYRSSYEINTFSQKVLGQKQDIIPFERHEEAPKVVQMETQEQMDRAIVEDIAYYTKQGYESIAVICKTQQEAEKVYSRLLGIPQNQGGLEKQIPIKMVKPQHGQLPKGALVIPSYMAKGLEFDVVIVYGADKENYSSEFDRKLLYIACTRALHRLALYYTGRKSPFLMSIFHD